MKSKGVLSRQVCTCQSSYRSLCLSSPKWVSVLLQKQRVHWDHHGSCCSRARFLELRMMRLCMHEHVLWPHYLQSWCDFSSYILGIWESQGFVLVQTVFNALKVTSYWNTKMNIPLLSFAGVQRCIHGLSCVLNHFATSRTLIFVLHRTQWHYKLFHLVFNFIQAVERFDKNWKMTHRSINHRSIKP